MKPALILRDPGIQPFPAYSPEDAAGALRDGGWSPKFITALELRGIRRGDADLLVMPYLDGVLGEAEWAGLLNFHESGGGILFLGDLPHVGRWYPLRNGEAFRLRLTRCRDRLKISDWTPDANALCGVLPGLERFRDRWMVGVRTTAFPPDRARFLVDGKGDFRRASPVVLVERHCPRFLGARTGIVGFDGGEPRENVLGVCQLPHSFQPGLLDRDWSGTDCLVQRLAEALIPAPVAGTIELQALIPAEARTPLRVRIRNLSDGRQRVDYSLRNRRTGQELLSERGIVIESGAFHRSPSLDHRASLGPTEFELRIAPERGPGLTATRLQCAYAADNPHPLGLGFSTYWTFRTERLDAEFVEFLQEMKKLGAQYARIAISWEDTETAPGRYRWSIPDRILQLADRLELKVLFWVFPTARGSGLGEAGAPAWALKEPSIDRHGRPGNFPCLWSPFYRRHYFGFLAALARRYGTDPRLFRFVFDFGNSDFPYSYHYYGGPADEFDYSPHEQRAFANYLQNVLRMPLAELSERWKRPLRSYREVPVPHSEEREAWLVYDEFRSWGLNQGIQEAGDILQRLAPDKMPPDFPGHGWGSIADLSTFVQSATARHWDEYASITGRPLRRLHMGREWGGEPWQVGGTYRDYDDALFQSVRLEATYFTIPGPDLGLAEEDLARVAMVRRTLMGARRSVPRVAILDRTAWNEFGSLAHVGIRLDQPVDLVSRESLFDFAGYALMVLPANEIIQSHRGIESLLPTEREFYLHLADCIRRGLRLLVFPETGTTDQRCPLRTVFHLEDVRYGERRTRRVAFPASFGGGEAEGMAQSVDLPGGRAILADIEGEPVLVERPMGRGAILLAGYDSRGDSLDGDVHYGKARNFATHTLPRLLMHLGVPPSEIDTGQAGAWKEIIHRDDKDYLLFYTHLESPLDLTVNFHPHRPPSRAMDLATGTEYPVSPGAHPDWYAISLRLQPMTGCYVSLHD